MAKLMITKGLPASGKSTWARAQEGFVVVEKDEIRKALEANGWTWSHKNEKDVLKIQENRIVFLLEKGKSVISADTNFGKHEERLKKLAEDCGAEFAVRDFTDVPLQTCIDRNKARPRDEQVPEQAIIDMWKKYVDPQLKPVPVKWVSGLEPAVICDLDGTLAIHNGRSPYDTAKCETDLLNRSVDAVLTALWLDGHKVIFVSGREDKFRPETSRWLDKNGWGDCLLHMRKTGDFRNDAVVKNEIFDEFIRNRYNVICVLDDRDRVVKRWRELGLACFQVNYGTF